MALSFANRIPFHIARIPGRLATARTLQSLRTRNILLKCGCSSAYHSGRGVYGHRPELSKEGVILQDESVVKEADRNRSESASFIRLVESYRTHGHRAAHINPLLEREDGSSVPEIDRWRYGYEKSFTPKGVVHWREVEGRGQVPTEEGEKLLRQTYTSQTGFEFMHIENEAEREWFASQVESTFLDPVPSEYKVRLAKEMAKCQNFDHFLAAKYPNVKRYGGEGCESMVGFFMEMFRLSPELGIDNIVIGNSHRGKLNFMTGLLKFPPSRMFQKMKGLSEFPPEARTIGDVLTHLYTSVDVEAGTEGDQSVHVSLLPNPSHLEIVNPVAIGKVRAKLKQLERYDYSTSNDEAMQNPSVLAVQVHGDAAVAGQGVNQETLGLANVPHYRVGGSLHLIMNNQIGFTTPAEQGRSSRYTSDIAKVIGAPVIHVNGDCPEDIVKATRIALNYRQTFHKDIFVDLMCFRRWGHNEMDDPTFTNPLMYKLIHARKSIPDLYSEQLISQGLMDESEYKNAVSEHSSFLNEEFQKVDSFVPPDFYLKKQWEKISQAGMVITEWDTGVDIPLLKYIGQKSVTFPESFNIHPHLAKTFVKARLNRITEGAKIDWATAEALSIGSLLYQGHDVRLSGEDVGRGTFSQRHAMLVEQNTGEMFIPLNELTEGEETQQGKLEIANSTLSEEAVLAFEWGFSLENPDNLVIWEAQFGDFFNGAQIPIDTMIASGEIKWMLHTGMVMLLPHGMDGTGPEHSSCRLERFLQLTDSSEESHQPVDGDYNNIHIVNPSTPAQYFHLLRRQMLRNFRKPLVVVAPKTLLRLSAATSSLGEMSPGTTFQPVLDDSQTVSNPKQVKRLIFVSGKHFYTLSEKRTELDRKDVAIIRLESLCPFPVQELQQILQTYSNATEFVWSQEEHQNMGAWTFIKPIFENFLGCRIKYRGRGPLAAPAVGIGRVHRAEVEHINKTSFE